MQKYILLGLGAVALIGGIYWLGYSAGANKERALCDRKIAAMNAAQAELQNKQLAALSKANKASTEFEKELKNVKDDCLGQPLSPELLLLNAAHSGS